MKTGSSIREVLNNNSLLKDTAFQEILEGHAHKVDRNLIGFKQEAYNTFKDSGLPTRKMEEWKYSPLPAILKRHFNDEHTPTSPVDIDEYLKQAEIKGYNGNFLVFVNGILDDSRSKLIDKDAGLNIFPLIEAKDQIIDRLKTENPYNDPLIHLNNAFFEKGTYWEIPDGTELKHPVYCVYLSDGTQNLPIDYYRNYFSIGKNVNAHFIHRALTTDSNTIQHIFNQFKLSGNSQVYNYDIQGKGNNGISLNNMEAQLGRDDTFNNYSFTSAGSVIRNSGNYYLDEPGSEVNLFGLYSLSGNSHFDNRTLVDHKAPHCNSNEIYKGILDGKTTGVFNGKVMVRPDAQKTLAYQKNPNIILSGDAVAYSKPQLEIYADDVKCSHGATSGQLDNEALFYLRSRGLGLEDARSMLVYAFASEIIDAVEIPELQLHLRQHIQGKLLMHD